MNEKQIEDGLIKKFLDLKYTYRDDIKNKASLEQNFRKKFEDLNHVHLIDSEFARLRDEIISADVFTSARTLRERNHFQREDGTPLHYTLIDIENWCKNEFEVINQLRINTDYTHHKYDVIVLINGLPVVQIELKTLDISPRRAMEQIVDYKNDPGNGYTNSLLCFIQLFVVSNRTNTYYFANNNHNHFAFNAEEHFLPVYKMAGQDNKKITHLDDFSDHFFSKCTLGETIGRYMVLVASEQKLMIMRPYQIYAVKAIVDCIQQNRGNGYIWHTTGSGKTLTSFKASTLLKDNHEIDKCLFVVDRKDLDKQTREEFNKFQEGCVEENTNTKVLVKRLLSKDYADKVIVSTIQKLGLALGDSIYRKDLKLLSEKRVVFIFDECHRSQFGENHRAIKDFFPHSQLFGFTGTPIFEENSKYKKIDKTIGTFKTTENLFQKQLHAYTITNAIDDRNVLRFHIDYFKPEDSPEGNNNVAGSVSRKAIVEAILSRHDIATNKRRFNALLATASINNAIEYYNLFKKIQKDRKEKNESFMPLNIACVFSPPAEGNQDIRQLQEDLEQEKADNQREPERKKQALNTIIEDYNRLYSMNYSINGFDDYYQDVQQRIKNQKYPNSDCPHENKIDITIVVDMLLTGFDSKYLNTLYVDKNLKHHGLIQAFSRTNRVLNNTKPYGNILDFRQQQEEVNEAIKLFSGNDKESAREIWIVEPASEIIDRLDEAVADLERFMKLKKLSFKPEDVNNLEGDIMRGEFINRFKDIQRLKVQLDQYTDLSEEQKEKIENIIPEEQMRGFRSMYLETAQRLKNPRSKSDDDSELDSQHLDFEFVLFSSAVIDYDYIMGLIAQYGQSQDQPEKQEMTRKQLIELLKSTSNLMDEREDMIDYINSLDAGKGLNEQEIRVGYEKFKEQKYANVIKKIAQKHKLKSKDLNDFVDDIMDRMIFDAEKLTTLMASLNLNWKVRVQKESELMEDLIPLLERLAQGREISGLSTYDEKK